MKILKQKIRKFVSRAIEKDFFHVVVAYLCYLYIRFVGFTSRIEYVNLELVRDLIKEKRPVILAFWHGQLFILTVALGKVIRGIDGAEFGVLTSKHRDGRFIGRIMKAGFVKHSLEGSSHDKRIDKKHKDKGGFKAAREMISLIKSRVVSFAIAVDGPRGPRGQIHGETLAIAKISGAVVVPMAMSYSKCRVLGTWDALRVALPFGKIRVEFGEVFEYDRGAKGDKLDKYNAKLKKRLDGLTKSSQKIVGL
jgi:lysophospholipid acyltransferase (LPLAT)-like uncharacterized protein